jgi:hypothetical protein
MPQPPVPPTAAITPLMAAAKKIKGLIDEAQDAKKTELNRTLAYLRAGREAIWSLEQECDGIFADAALVNVADATKVDALIERCHRYLHEHHVLPELERCVQGLKDTQAAIAHRADDYKQWPWKKSDRKSAASEFGSQLTAFTQYLEKIRGQDLAYLSSGTGPQADRVVELESMLKTIRAGKLDNARLQLDRRVSWARSDPDKGGWIKLTSEVERLSNRLLEQFS